MKYSEKEQKGIDKVANMNRFFDKILMPTVGVLIIITLLLFIGGRVREKFGGSGEGTASSSGTVSSDASEASELMSLRHTLLAGYADHREDFAACGYLPAEGYTQDVALRRQVDEELVIFQFVDDTVGDFTVIKYAPAVEDFGYTSLSLTVSSESLLSVRLRGEDFDWRVSFTATEFSAHSPDDEADYRRMMKRISTDDLKAMYALFVTDLHQLAESCRDAA